MSIAALAGRQAVAVAPYRTVLGIGTADDAPSIQAAIDAANEAYVEDGVPRTVRVMGEFNLPQTSAPAINFPGAGYGRRCALAIRPGVNLRAEKDAVFKATQADVECFIAPLASGDSFDDIPARKDMTGDNWSVSGIIFDCNQTVGAEFNGGVFSVGTSSDWSVTDCEFKRCRGDAMSLIVGAGEDPPTRWRFERNTVSQFAGQTILCDIRGTGPMTDITIADNTTRNGTTTAETYVVNGNLAVQAERVVFAKNRMFDTATNVFVKCNDIVIEGNEMYQPADSQGAALDFSGDGITITGNILDSSAASAGGANHPFRCTGVGTKNVTITGNVFRCGFAGCKSTGGSDWTVSNNVIETVAGSTDAATAVALNLGGVAGVSAVGNRIYGSGFFNCLTVGADSQVVGNWLDDNGYIGAGARSVVSGNHVSSAPPNDGNPGQTFVAIGVAGDSRVIGNRATAGTTGGVVVASGANVIIQGNILENTLAGGYYYNAITNKVWVLDNMGIATAAVGAAGSGDGFSVGGTGSIERNP